MNITLVHSEDAPRAQGPYSQAIVTGDLVFCAGQLPVDPSSGTLVESDITAQTSRALENLAAVLAAAGSDLAHVVKTTVFLEDMADFAAMNEAYRLRFGEHRPARATVEVSALPRGARVEIECVAVLI